MSQLNFTHCPLCPEHVPDCWKVVAVGEILDSIQTGFASGKHNSEGVGVPHLRPMNISPDGTIDLTDARFVDGENPLRVRRGDILFNNTNSPAWVGKTAVIEADDDYAFSNHMTRLRVSSGITPAFVAKQLHFLCRSGYFQHQCKKHVNQASINRTFLGNATPLVLAPKNEQRRIVAKIDSLQERSSRARAALAEVKPLLDHFRQSVLQAAFSGRLTADWRARNPDVEPASELLARIRTERRRCWEKAQLAKYEAKGKKPPKNWKERYKEPTALDESKLPDLPSTWCWTSLDTLIVDGPTNGYSPKTSRDATGTPALKLSATTRRRLIINEDTTKRLNEVMPDNSTYWLTPGDILIQRSNSLEYVGATVLYDGPPSTYVYPDIITRVRVTESVERQLLAQLLNCPEASQFFKSNATGTAGNMPKINGTTIRRAPIPLPPIAEQKATQTIINEALTTAIATEVKAEEIESNLSQLDRSTLAKAFRGELVPRDPREESVPKSLTPIQNTQNQA